MSVAEKITNLDNDDSRTCCEAAYDYLMSSNVSCHSEFIALHEASQWSKAAKHTGFQNDARHWVCIVTTFVSIQIMVWVNSLWRTRQKEHQSIIHDKSDVSSCWLCTRLWIALMSADIARNLWSLVCSCLNSYCTFFICFHIWFFKKNMLLSALHSIC